MTEEKTKRAAHTKGPWFCRQVRHDDGSHLWFEIHNRGDTTLADTYVGICTTDKDVGASEEANARLIASAPALLEALSKTLGVAESWIHDQLDGTRSLDAALAELEPARAAIKQARGE